MITNSSFKKIAICHVGIDAGFFCEYSYMLEIMLYCLEHQIQFKLYSKDANFGYDKGWTDYFEPFCVEVIDSFHHFCNFHSIQPWNRIWKNRKMIESISIKWKIKLEILSLYGKLMKLKKGDFNYYTYDITDRLRTKDSLFCIPDLNFKGNYLDVFRLVDSIAWHFNDATHSAIEMLIATLNLPKHYIGCQIRGGDKNIEFELSSPNAYINKLRVVSSLKDVFVLTDDYQLLEQLREKAPDYHFYSLCQLSERGYYNRIFTKYDGETKRLRMERFFASMEILRNADLFVGTFTSGPSIYIANLKWPKVFFVDLDESEYIDALAGKCNTYTYKRVYR